MDICAYIIDMATEIEPTSEVYEATCINLPADLKNQARAAGINMSAVLRKSLREELGHAVSALDVFHPDDLGVLIREADGVIRYATMPEQDAWHQTMSAVPYAPCDGCEKEAQRIADGFEILEGKAIMLYVR
jgi:post-segregation antitoxin (ccd killing protein)